MGMPASTATPPEVSEQIGGRFSHSDHHNTTTLPASIQDIQYSLPISGAFFRRGRHNENDQDMWSNGVTF
jgi:hypothetical protein